MRIKWSWLESFSPLKPDHHGGDVPVHHQALRRPSSVRRIPPGLQLVLGLLVELLQPQRLAGQGEMLKKKARGVDTGARRHLEREREREPDLGAGLSRLHPPPQRRLHLVPQHLAQAVLGVEGVVVVPDGLGNQTAGKKVPHRTFITAFS